MTQETLKRIARFLGLHVVKESMYVEDSMCAYSAIIMNGNVMCGYEFENVGLWKARDAYEELKAIARFQTTPHQRYPYVSKK